MKDKKPKPPSPEVRQRIVDDMMQNVVMPQFSPDRQTAEEALVEKAKKIHFLVISDIRNFIKTVGYDTAMDNQAGLKQIIADKYIAHFRELDKEELIFLLTMLHVEICFEKI